MRITDLAKAIAPDCKIEYTGIRPGEKIHECLLTEDEARHSLEFDNFFVIEPEYYWWSTKDSLKTGKRLPDAFRYTSDKNDWWLQLEELKKIAGT
jgi:UDP-N-acetylglucosamine 4,6-dehydratase